MKKYLYAFLLLLSFGSLYGQNTYSMGVIPFNPSPFGAGTPTGLMADDMYSAAIALPFSFCFYDQSYDSIVIGTNGVVSFDISVAGGYCPWPLTSPAPNSSLTNKSIMAPIQDLNPVGGGSINYDVQGVAPFRRFVISYDSVAMFSCTSLYFSEQIILYETSNVIETHILDKPLCATWNNGAAIHGIQVDSATGFIALGRNHPTQWTATNDGFRFTPIGTCAGAPPTDAVSGKVYIDYNNNCIQDGNDLSLPNRAVVANGGQFYSWTGANGQYMISMAPGTYTVNEYSVALPFYVSNCVPGGTYNVTLSGTPYTNADFADSVDVICSDLTVGVGSTIMRRCNVTTAGITYCNVGTYPDSNVVVTVNLIDSLQIISASAPYTSLGLNSYAFSVGNLLPGQCGTINLVLDVGCDTVGTEYCITASIIGTYPTECNYNNNSDGDCQVLVAAFDPNEKRVASNDGHGYVINDEMDANDELSYVINFQNLGTSYAEDVEIRDTLDAVQLRLETFTPGAGIAPYNWVLIGNVAIFRFEDIFLQPATVDEPGSHGFVKFSIQQQPGHGPGTVIHNQAGIYFDQEPVVMTNQTTNTIPLASAVGAGLADVANVFPNPGQDQLMVQQYVEESLVFVLCDLTGKEVRRVELTGVRTAVSTTDLGAGVYLYRLENAEGLLREVGKWMKN
jgi:uncharacterized repeat protein (TIGR01451 family)